MCWKSNNKIGKNQKANGKCLPMNVAYGIEEDTRALPGSTTIQSTEICQLFSLAWLLLMCLHHAVSLWFPSHTKKIFPNSIITSPRTTWATSTSAAGEASGTTSSEFCWDCPTREKSKSYQHESILARPIHSQPQINDSNSK